MGFGPSTYISAPAMMTRIDASRPFSFILSLLHLHDGGSEAETREMFLRHHDGGIDRLLLGLVDALIGVDDRLTRFHRLLANAPVVNLHARHASEDARGLLHFLDLDDGRLPIDLGGLERSNRPTGGLRRQRLRRIQMKLNRLGDGLAL